MSHDWTRNATRRSELRATLSGDNGASDRRVDIVFCPNEINDRHGTGILIQRMFPLDARNVVTVRGQSEWGGEQEFGAAQLVIPSELGRSDIYRWTLEQIAGFTVRHIYCIPWGTAEICAALAVRDAYQVPFCLYIMDDQNITTSAIPDDLMAEAVTKATLRLAISSDMRDAYEAKYDRRFWIAPPTIPEGVEPVASSPGRGRGRAVIVGNIWAQEWVAALTDTIRLCALKVDWFCNAPGGGNWIDPGSLRELEESGVVLRDPLPAHELVARLGDYEVALMPTVPELGRRQNFAVAALSLPSRIPLLIGAGDLPIIVIGDPGTCVARFVDHFGIGFTCPYRGDALRHSLMLTREDAWRAQQRASLRDLRRILTETDIAAWVQTALTHGAPIGSAFEALDVQPPGYVRHFIADTVPLGPWLQTYDPVQAAFRRMATCGYAPDFIIDAGASTGVWSYAASRVFPQARFVLIEPLLSRYDQSSSERFMGALERLDVCECALGPVDGDGTLRVEGSVYEARLAVGLAAESRDEQHVSVRSLDSLASELELSGTGILKLDIQGGELDALRGGQDLLATGVDAVVAEVTIDPPRVGMPSYADVDDFMRDAGFTLFDEVGTWRQPQTGMLIEKDVLYVRREHPLAGARRSAALD